MATIKAYTTIEQSRKLAEILSPESSDMVYTIINGYHTPWIRIEKIDELDKDDVCAWSLAALYGILPNNKKESTTLSRGGWKIEPVEYIDKWFCEYEDEVDEDSPCKAFTVSADNPIDACYEVIIKLYELKIL